MATSISWPSCTVVVSRPDASAARAGGTCARAWVSSGPTDRPTGRPGGDNDRSGFGDAPFEEPALGGRAGQVERAPVGAPGLVPAAEPPQEVGPGRGPVLV